MDQGANTAVSMPELITPILVAIAIVAMMWLWKRRTKVLAEDLVFQLETVLYEYANLPAHDRHSLDAAYQAIKRSRDLIAEEAHGEAIEGIRAWLFVLQPVVAREDWEDNQEPKRGAEE